MLTRSFLRYGRLIPARLFGSAHATEVKLDLNKEYIKTSKDALDYQGMWILEESNPHPVDPTLNSDALDYEYRFGRFSYEMLFHASDPGHHPTSEDKYGNTYQGYLFPGEDPMDQRNLADVNNLLFYFLAGVIVVLTMLYGTHKRTGRQEKYQFEDYKTAESLDDELLKIRAENQRLQDKLKTLKESL